MGCQRVYTSNAMATAAEVCKRDSGIGRAAGEGICCGPAASTGPATREGTCRGSTTRREGNTSIQKIDAKAWEHTSAPTKSALERPLSQERQGKDKGEPALKKARRTSAGAPLVSESDTEESESEVVGIACGVRESRPKDQHVSPRQERAQRERERRRRHRDTFKKGVLRSEIFLPTCCAGTIGQLRTHMTRLA